MSVAGCGLSPDVAATDETFPEESSDEVTSEILDDEPSRETAACDGLYAWESTWVTFEDAVLVLVNEARAAGAVCGEESYPPVDPLSSNSKLRCAARGHSQDMAERDFFDHTNPDGDGPDARLSKAGYDGSTWGENIAFGQADADAVMAGWMNSPGHCRNIMRASFSEIGVGYYSGSMWTQAFGAP